MFFDDLGALSALSLAPLYLVVLTYELLGQLLKLLLDPEVLSIDTFVAFFEVGRFVVEQINSGPLSIDQQF